MKKKTFTIVRSWVGFFVVVCGSVAQASALAADTNSAPVPAASPAPAVSTTVSETSSIQAAPAATGSGSGTPRSGMAFGGTYDHGSIGVGAVLGEPMGFSAKYWFTDRSAVDLAMGWSFDDPSGFDLHSDYLFHKFDLISVSHGRMPLYFGGGARLKFPDHGDTRFGFRGPVGLAYQFEDTPIEVFAEVGPILDVTPAVQLRWSGGIGARFYFR